MARARAAPRSRRGSEGPTRRCPDRWPTGSRRRGWPPRARRGPGRAVLGREFGGGEQLAMRWGVGIGQGRGTVTGDRGQAGRLRAEGAEQAHENPVEALRSGVGFVGRDPISDEDPVDPDAGEPLGQRNGANGSFVPARHGNVDHLRTGELDHGQSVPEEPACGPQLRHARSLRPGRPRRPGYFCAAHRHGRARDCRTTSE